MNKISVREVPYRAKNKTYALIDSLIDILHKIRSVHKIRVNHNFEVGNEIFEVKLGKSMDLLKN